MAGDQAYGLIACVVTAILFGSMFVPVKNFEIGDGFFVQFCMDFGIFLVGIFVNIYARFPTFHPLAMIGGALWAIGNAMAPTVVSTVGLGMGTLLWSVVNCLIGWAISRFGLFGTKAAPPSKSGLNYAGLVLVLVGGVFFALVEPVPKVVKRKDTSTEKTTIKVDGESRTTKLVTSKEDDGIAYADGTSETAEPSDNAKTDVSVMEEVKEEKKLPKSFLGKIGGVGLALFSGLFYGATFVPVLYIQNHPTKYVNVSQDNLDYVHAYFTGHLFCGLLVFVLYTIFKRNKPFMDNQMMVPAIVGGAFWGIGCTGWFIATNYVSQAISFPINTMVPGCVATLWSAILFREIRGARNYILSLIGIVITIAGAIMVGASS